MSKKGVKSSIIPSYQTCLNTCEAVDLGNHRKWSPFVHFHTKMVELGTDAENMCPLNKIAQNCK